VILSSFFLSATLWAAPARLSLLEQGSHCVAYKAEKTMFLFKSDPVIGRNCDVSAQVLPDVGGIYHIEVIIPIRSFASGDASRDEDVAKSLKVDVKPELTFRTKAMSAEAWREIFKKSNFDLVGELAIGDQTFPIKVASHYTQHDDTEEIDGVAKVRFEDFQIPPPKVVGGLVAKTKPELELHFNLLGSRILGADSIALEKNEEKK
jgi:YceI-like domain